MPNRPYIVAIDFDDTIADNSFPNINTATIKPHCVEVINKLYNEGFYIIIWTARYLENHIQDVKDFLKVHNVNYDCINENYPLLEFKPTPKIYYDVLIDDRAQFCIDWKWIYQYIKVKLVESKYYTITPQMREHYFNRTKNHIELVNKFYKKLTKSSKPGHDYSKFIAPELEFYIAITWRYYCKENNIIFEVSPELNKKMNYVTEYHIKNNLHHPECWSPQVDNLINTTDRDSNEVTIIDATDMPNNALEEMACDWCAVSFEKGTNPFDWYDSVVGIRWNFTLEQKLFLRGTLEVLWNN